MIIALDLGENLGIAVGDPGGRPECETLVLPGDTGAMMLRVEGRLRSYFNELEVTRIVYEDPFPALGKKWQQTGQAHLKKHLTIQFGQKAMIEKVAHAEYGLRPNRVHVGAARKAVVGKGYPTEDEILAAVRRRGAVVGTHHEADAAVIFYAALAGVFQR